MRCPNVHLRTIFNINVDSAWIYVSPVTEQIESPSLVRAVRATAMRHVAWKQNKHPADFKLGV